VAFISFTVGALAKTGERPMLNCVSEATIEGIEQRCAETASEMHCPGQRSARVIVDGAKFEHLELEIICCRDRFANRVRDALQERLNPG
jgi:hypothetical protein